MPRGVREFFEIAYAFPPPGQADPDAKYFVIFAGASATDGPNGVFPPVAGDVEVLSCEFRVPGTMPDAPLEDG
jgi:hypothetical protein